MGPAKATKAPDQLQEWVDLVVQRWKGIAGGEDPQLGVQVPGMPPTAQLADEIRNLLGHVLGGQ